MGTRTEEQAMRYGLPAHTYSGDPRLSEQQDRAIGAAAMTDPQARLLGLDDKHRPVVRARVGIPRRVVTWAVLRNGDPTDAGEVREQWSE